MSVKINITDKNGNNVDIYDVFSFYNHVNDELTRFERTFGYNGIQTKEQYDSLVKRKEEITKDAPEYYAFVDGKRFKIKYREDMWNHKTKEPNVVFLQDENEKNKYVLREARIYGPNSGEMRNLRNIVFRGKSKLDDDAYKKLFLGGFDGYDKRKYFLIPEPILLYTMKKISDEHGVTNVFPEIIPINSVRDGKDGTKNFYYLRKYFNEPGDINEIVKTTLPLKLLMFADLGEDFREEIYEDKNHVMIDPDFFLIGKSNKREIQELNGLIKEAGLEKINFKNLLSHESNPNAELLKKINFLELMPKSVSETEKLFFEWYEKSEFK